MTGRARIAVAVAVVVAFAAAFGIAYVAGSGSEAEGEPAGTVTRGLTGSAGTLRAGESVTIPRVRPMPTVAGLRPPPAATTTRAPSSPPDQGGAPRRAESVADAHPVAHARSERRGGWLLDRSRALSRLPVRGGPARSRSVSVGLCSIPERGGEP